MDAADRPYAWLVTIRFLDGSTGSVARRAKSAGAAMRLALQRSQVVEVVGQPLPLSQAGYEATYGRRRRRRL